MWNTIKTQKYDKVYLEYFIFYIMGAQNYAYIIIGSLLLQHPHKICYKTQLGLDKGLNYTIKLVNICTTEMFTFTLWYISLIKPLCIIREWIMWNTVKKPQNMIKFIWSISFFIKGAQNYAYIIIGSLLLQHPMKFVSKGSLVRWGFKLHFWTS